MTKIDQLEEKSMAKHLMQLIHPQMPLSLSVYIYTHASNPRYPVINGCGMAQKSKLKGPSPKTCFTSRPLDQKPKRTKTPRHPHKKHPTNAPSMRSAAGGPSGSPGLNTRRPQASLYGTKHDTKSVWRETETRTPWGLARVFMRYTVGMRITVGKKYVGLYIYILICYSVV